MNSSYMMILSKAIIFYGSLESNEDYYKNRYTDLLEAFNQLQY